MPATTSESKPCSARLCSHLFLWGSSIVYAMCIYLRKLVSRMISISDDVSLLEQKWTEIFIGGLFFQ